MSEQDPSSRAGTGRRGEASDRPDNPPPQIQAVPDSAKAKADAIKAEKAARIAEEP